MATPRTLDEILLDRLTAQPRKRIPFDDLAAAYTSNPALLAAPERRQLLADALTVLRDTGALKLPVTRKFWDYSALPPLPQWAERIDPPRPVISSPQPDPG